MTSVAATADLPVEVEILVETGTYEGGWKFASLTEIPDDYVGENYDFEAIIRIGRRVWDEAYTGLQGCSRRISFITYGPNCPDGHAVRMEHRP